MKDIPIKDIVEKGVIVVALLILILTAAMSILTLKNIDRLRNDILPVVTKSDVPASSIPVSTTPVATTVVPSTAVPTTVITTTPVLLHSAKKK